MYLKRKIDAFLEEWKADVKRKPLVIKGSRQIGKTESVLHFAAANYENIIEINFVRDEKYKGIIADGYETADIIKNISLIDPSKKFVPGKTLIFFDEITAFPEIATSLKFFCIDGRFDVICSGSMLGVNYKRIESNSVGYKKDYEMFSMDFEEFLWAKGYGNDTVENMLSHMKQFTPFNELEMKIFHSLFLDYNVLGGMPAVVKEYTERNTFEGSLDMQKQLVADYKEDIRKYADGIDQTRITNMPPDLIKRVFSMLFARYPFFLEMKIKNFRFPRWLPARDSAIIGGVQNGWQMPEWLTCAIAWSFRSCRSAGIMIPICSNCILLTRGSLYPCLMMNRRKISEQIKILEFIKAHSSKTWRVKRLPNRVINCSITRKRIQRLKLISLSVQHRL